MPHHPTATVCGSFHRALPEIQSAVSELNDAGVRVLSPADPRVVDAFGDFMYVASDRLRAIKAVQSRHLAAVERADFVWLVAPDGYIGLSAAMEIGFATRCGTPVFTASAPADLTLRQYVHVVSDITSALHRMRDADSREVPVSALLDPETTLAAAHQHLESVQHLLVTSGSAQAESLVHAHADRVRSMLRHL
jgi:hypothetical protein